MNILFIGPYLQNDGWGRAARNYVEALKLTGHTIATRPIYMGSKLSPDRNVFKDLEISLKSYDAVIQNVLPEFMEFDGRFGKNIGLCYTETSGLEHTGWIEKTNLMDAIIVPSYADTVNLIDSTTPMYTVPIPVDSTKFEKSYDKLITSEDFLFYFIGEHTERKNMVALVEAFNLEFGLDEQVSLVIKTNHPGLDKYTLEHSVNADIWQLKDIMRLYQSASDYKKEILILDDLDDEGMCKLHCSCDCFVMPSRGEAFNIPAIDAMGFGKTPIVTNRTGMTEFVDEDTGYLVNANDAPVLTGSPPMPNIYSAYETWKEIDVIHLRKRLREAYNDKGKKKLAGMDRIYDFSYQNIATKLNKVLSSI